MESRNSPQNEFVNVATYKDDYYLNKWSQTKFIEHMLVRERFNNRSTTKIFVPDLKLLYKNPETAITTLVRKGVIKRFRGEYDDVIELNTRIAYCIECRGEVFYWDRWNHLVRHHAWHKYDLEFNSKYELVEKESKGLHPAYAHNPWETRFSSKPYPQKEDHEYEQIGELQDNKFTIRCKKCGDIRPIYINDIRNGCDPYDKSIYVENPEDETNIRFRIGRSDAILTAPTKLEYNRFVANTIKQLEEDQ